jgi:hypothetical protein
MSRDTIASVVGHQYWWEYRYPGLGVVTANELHVPVSDPTHPAPTRGMVRLRTLTSQTFSPGHSMDFWTLALLISGFGSIGTAINIVVTIVVCAARG